MLKTLSLLLIFILSTAVFADDESSQAAVFQKGLAAYQNKQYEEARGSFQALLDQGLVTAEILHNLALANYQLNQKPLALALWRKALTLEPTFRAARSGREFTENELNQRGYERDQITQFLRTTLEFLSFYEATWIIALLMGVAGWMWIGYMGERKAAFDEERPLPAFPTAAVIVSVVLVLCMGLTALKARQNFRTRATIIGATVNARSLPSDEGVSLFELRGGSEVLIRRQEKDWAQVLYSDGNSGWVKDSELYITSGG